MDSTVEQSTLDIFERHRPRLFALAYRMLGTAPSRIGMRNSARRRLAWVWLFAGGVFATDAFAQSARIDLAGEWAARVHEDAVYRGAGGLLGDYTGLPINDFAISYNGGDVTNKRKDGNTVEKQNGWQCHHTTGSEVQG